MQIIRAVLRLSATIVKIIALYHDTASNSSSFNKTVLSPFFFFMKEPLFL
jgi:hypothetical protein